MDQNFIPSYKKIANPVYFSQNHHGPNGHGQPESARFRPNGPFRFWSSIYDPNWGIHEKKIRLLVKIGRSVAVFPNFHFLTNSHLQLCLNRDYVWIFGKLYLYLTKFRGFLHSNGTGHIKICVQHFLSFLPIAL